MSKSSHVRYYPHVVLYLCYWYILSVHFCLVYIHLHSQIHSLAKFQLHMLISLGVTVLYCTLHERIKRTVFFISCHTVQLLYSMHYTVLAQLCQVYADSVTYNKVVQFECTNAHTLLGKIIMKFV